MKRRTASYLKKATRRAEKQRIHKENLSKIQLLRLKERATLKTFGKIAGLYKSKRGTEYFAWHLPQVGGFPGSLDYTKEMRVVPIHTLRLPVLRQCTIDAAEALQGEELETVLDFLFAELNKRLNKNA